MTSESVRTMASFSWASAARYVAYVEQVAGLKPVSDLQIYSFRVPSEGTGKLIKKKEGTRRVLEENLSALATWVGGNRDTLNDDEKVILRSYYRGIKAALEIVNAHLKNARELADWLQLYAFDEEERKEEDLGDDEDDLLF